MIHFDSPVRGSTKIVCLLGYPVSHSISPQIHNHAFRNLGLNYVYIPLPVAPESFHTAIHALRAFKIAGANVTIPHKQQAVHYCDVISELSARTGTVNTIHLRDGLLYGTTTDYEGFRRAVQTMDFDFKGKNVVMLGNGGTARTLASALAFDNEIATLTIAGRNRTKVDNLTQKIHEDTGFCVSSCDFSAPEFKSAMESCDLLVNTTSVGMYPYLNETPISSTFFHKNMKVFDVIYNPAKTRFLAEAESAGCRVQNGLRMLLYQGLASFRIWTGADVPENLYSIEMLQNLIGK